MGREEVQHHAKWGGIPADRVAAVVADLDTGHVQVGSGYLVSRYQVLTARHCTIDKKTGRQARSLRVVLRSTGVQATATVLAASSDVAVLAVSKTSAWTVPETLEPPPFGKVDRSRSGELLDCQAIGFPLWQLDPTDQQRNAAELHGTIRLTEDSESGLLVMRDPLLNDVAVPATVTAEDRADGSAWGGLSGALVFHEGLALGVIIEHHPRQGRAAVRILPVERFAEPSPRAAAETVTVAAALGLPSNEELPVAGRPLLTMAVDVLIHGRLPRVGELDPYTLGATVSEHGRPGTYGQRDQYVARTKDESLAAALCPGHMVVLVGPSKAGKTRTAFEVLRRHDRWRDALLAAPEPQSASQLAEHPAINNREPLVIWLDDLQRFLPPAGDLSQAAISRLLDRPGPTLLLASLRTEQRELLRGPAGELTREVRVILDSAVTIDLDSTREDPGEQARAEAAYPQVKFRHQGLAEILAGAPELLRRYRDAAAAEPVLHVMLQTCIDWVRCGLPWPISEAELLAFTRDTLAEARPDLDPHDTELVQALRSARKPFAGGGQVALLRTYRLPGRFTGYEPFDYLVAADDSQGDSRARPVTETTWRRFLDHAAGEDLSYIGAAAYQRDNLQVAVAALRRAPAEVAEDHPGRAGMLSNLGIALNARFERDGDTAALDEAIDATREAVSATPAGHPNRALYLSNLGIALHTRYEFAGDLANLDEAVARSGEAVSATPADHPNRALYQSNLGIALYTRFERSGYTADLDASIDLTRQAVARTPQDHPSRAGMLSNLGIALDARFERVGDTADLDEAINATREAVSATPTDDPNRALYLSNLCGAVLTRFERIGDSADLDEAIQAAQQAVSATSSSQSDRVAYLSNLGSALLARFELGGNRPDLDAAIQAARQVLGAIQAGHPSRPAMLSNLGAALHSRFELAGEAADLDAAIDAGRAAVALTPYGSPDRARYLSSLGISLLSLAQRTRHPASLDEAIAAGEAAVDATPYDHPDRAAYLSDLGAALHTRFSWEGNPAVLDHAIDCWRAASKVPAGAPITRLDAARQWGAAAADAGHVHDAAEGYEAAVRLLPEVAWLGLDRMTRKEQLARWARSAPSAHEDRPRKASRDPATGHLFLDIPPILGSASITGEPQWASLAADAAACAVLDGRPEVAVELLEQGRSVLWTQSLSLRSDLTRLAEHAPGLAERLYSIRDILDTPLAAAAPLLPESAGDSAAADHIRQQPDAAELRRRAAREWDDLLAQVRALNGFESFLTAAAYSELATVATEGPVVIVNASRYGCHALIVTSDSQHVRVVDLTDMHLDTVVEHANQMQRALAGATDPRAHIAGERGIFNVLKWLWDVLAEPVLTTLGLTSTPEAGHRWPQVWWCPTGPLTALPIHAAGRHPRDPAAGSPDCVLNRVISSYTSSLTVLARTRQAPPPAPVQQLTVGIAAAPGQPLLPGVIEELKVLALYFPPGKGNQRLVEEQATRAAVLAAMATCSWVHLACPSVQDSEPDRSGFTVWDGTLTITDLAAQPTQHRELAFLSAPHTAVGSARYSDEAIHLAAAMQFLGYQHIIATLWDILDSPAARVAEAVYAELTWDGRPDPSRAAEALHHAISFLYWTHPSNPLFWLPYIHLGSPRS